MKRIIFIMVLLSAVLVAQCPPDTTGYQVIQDLTVCHTTVSYVVQYHPECFCYYYTYTLSSSQQNKGNIWYISYSLDTTNTYPVLDPSLPSLASCDLPASLFAATHSTMSRKELPHSFVSCPEKWDSSSHRGFACVYEGYRLAPGGTLTFAIASKYPPGPRTFKIKPYDKAAISQWQAQLPPDDEYEHFPGDADPPLALANVYGFDVSIMGPVDPSELTLYNGGGQKPSDVNLFLRYGNPTQAHTDLPAGTQTFEVTIYYGATVKPESFKAELNGLDISAQFHAVPGGGDAVKLPLVKGRNVVVFSVDALNQSGKTATDTDRLTLIVP